MMNADAVVVGGGLSGALVARSLQAEGLRILVLEAGPRPKGRLPSHVSGFEKKIHPHLDLDPTRWGYRNARKKYDWFRVRMLGGRSVLWGGWMDRPDAAYFRAREREGHPWPLSLAVLHPWLDRAEALLGVKTATLPPSLRNVTLGERALSPKREAVLDGQRRPRTALDLAHRRVVGDAIALRVLIDVDGKTEGVDALVAGKRTRVAAPTVILAASPVETARILHQSPRAASAGLGSALHDHLVAGAIAIGERPRIPTRKKGEADPTAGLLLPARHDEHRMTIEVRGPKPLDSLDDEDLEALGFNRAQAKKRALYAVFALAETDPGARRGVRFDELKPDALGRPTPVFDIEGLTDVEKARGRAMRERVREVARAVGGADAVDYLIQDARQLGGAGHETGTCPMGAPGDSVVDKTGAVHGVRGLFVADASPLPGALDRHPSLTLAAWALRAASYAAKAHARR